MRELLAARFSEQMLRQLPAILEAQRAAAAELTEHRQDLIAQTKRANEEFDRTDADLSAKLAPIEDKLAALRLEVERLEQDLAPLQTARQSARFARDGAVTALKAELRSSALDELEAFFRV